MKNFILLMGFILISTFALQAQTSTKIKVAGNCGMCKAHIEKAAKEAGAVTANWDKAAKVLKVSFDASKTSTDKMGCCKKDAKCCKDGSCCK